MNLTSNIDGTMINIISLSLYITTIVITLIFVQGKAINVIYLLGILSGALE